MQFVHVEEWQPAARELARRLKKELKKGPVLWLLSGGSNIAPAVAAMDSLPEELTEHLTISLIDERYGLPGHKDSNHKQLLDAGFNHKQATFMPVLQEGLTAQETTHHYAEVLERGIDHAQAIIGQLGIGSDGHIAGILPHSPAVEATGLATFYEAGPYQRITATFDTLRRLSAAYVLAFGENKRTALHKLEAENLTLAEQPAQILKDLKEAYIYNDQGGTS